MWTEQDFINLEESEHAQVLNDLAVMIAVLTVCGDNFSNELLKFYRKYGHNGVVSYSEARKYISNKDRRRRINVLFLSLNSLLDDAISRIQSTFSQLADKIIRTESKFFDVKVTEDDFILVKWGADSLTWKDRLLINKNKWLLTIQKEIKQSLIRGLAIDEILEIIEKRYDTMNNALKALVESESSATSTSVRQEIFKELDVKKYKFYSHPDERRCVVCGSLHGKEFPMSQYEVGTTAPPVHTHCRCWTVPL